MKHEFSDKLMYFCTSLLDLIFPRNEFFIGEPIERTAPRGCYLDFGSFIYLKRIKEPVCSICGYPIYGATDGSASCEKCRYLDPVFEGNRSFLLMNRYGSKIVHELKYRRGKYLKEDFLSLMRNSWVIDTLEKGSVLVPVPLHPKKFNQRGFNQSEWIAQRLVEISPVPVTLENLILRKKFTATQTLMDRSARARNVKGAFSIRKKRTLPAETPLIIVDDVFTTGATINECARVLKRAGFRNIRSITFGHG